MKNRVNRLVKMQIQGEEIPPIEGNPIKCLGKWFKESTTDKDNIAIEYAKKRFKTWLKIVDGSGLQWKYRAWIYQHGILPRLMWLLLIYEVASTTVEAMEKKVGGYLRRWFGVPPLFTSIGLYDNSTRAYQYPQWWKDAKCRLVMTNEQGSKQGLEESG